MGQFKLKSVRKWLKNSHKQAAGVPTKKMKRILITSVRKSKQRFLAHRWLTRKKVTQHQ